MANIKLNLPGAPFTGQIVTFPAPCDCNEVTDGLSINDKIYTVVDAMGRCVTGKGGRWAKGAIVSVSLDVEKKLAYIQNEGDVIVSDETAAKLGLETGATMDEALLCLNAIAGGKAVMAVGSYVGTGESEFALTFDFKPDMLMILNPSVRTWPFQKASEKEYPDTYVDRADRSITFIKGCTSYPTYGHYSNGSPTYFVDTHITVAFDGNNVSWSLPEEETFNGGGAQMTAPLVSGEGLFNKSGVTYFYFAIGKTGGESNG